MTARLRADLWCAAFVRRHNDLGHICVISRRGDPVAGQVWVELDHLNGAHSLFGPAPSILAGEDEGRVFQRRFDRVDRSKVQERLDREASFDPDFWIISLELRQGDTGLTTVEG